MKPNENRSNDHRSVYFNQENKQDSEHDMDMQRCNFEYLDGFGKKKTIQPIETTKSSGNNSKDIEHGYETIQKNGLLSDGVMRKQLMSDNVQKAERIGGSFQFTRSTSMDAENHQAKAFNSQWRKSFSVDIPKNEKKSFNNNESTFQEFQEKKAILTGSQDSSFKNDISQFEESNVTNTQWNYYSPVEY